MLFSMSARAGVYCSILTAAFTKIIKSKVLRLEMKSSLKLIEFEYETSVLLIVIGKFNSIC